MAEHQNVDRVKWLGVILLGELNPAQSGVAGAGREGDVHGSSTSQDSILAQSSIGRQLDSARILTILDFLKERNLRNAMFHDLTATGDKFTVSTDESSGITFVMITEEDYPGFVSLECIEALKGTWNEHQEKLERIQGRWFGRESKKRKSCAKFQTEINDLAYRYDNLTEVSPIHNLMEEIEELRQEMSNNIAAILENMESEEELLRRADELEKMAEVFEKKSKELASTMTTEYWTAESSEQVSSACAIM